MASPLTEGRCHVSNVRNLLERLTSISRQGPYPMPIDRLIQGRGLGAAPAQEEGVAGAALPGLHESLGGFGGSYGDRDDHFNGFGVALGRLSKRSGRSVLQALSADSCL